MPHLSPFQYLHFTVEAKAPWISVTNDPSRVSGSWFYPKHSYLFIYLYLSFFSEMVYSYIRLHFILIKGVRMKCHTNQPAIHLHMQLTSRKPASAHWHTYYTFKMHHDGPSWQLIYRDTENFAKRLERQSQRILVLPSAYTFSQWVKKSGASTQF